MLHAIHADLARCDPPLALPNIGSISDQTIGGLISTASHGSGVKFPVLSQHVRSLTLVLPLPGAPVVRASPTEDVELFKASLCGLGATGLMVQVEIEVEEAFRLKETKEGRSVDEVLENLDEIKQSAEHVRVWWYPDGQGMVVGRANRTYGVSRRGRCLLTRSPRNPRHRSWGISWVTTLRNSSSLPRGTLPFSPLGSVDGHGGFPTRTASSSTMDTGCSTLTVW